MLKQGLILLLVFVAGAAVGRFSLPAKVTEKEHIVYQDRIIEKKIEINDIKKKDHKIYIRIEKTSPDGTKTVEIRIVDDSSFDNRDTKKDDKTEDIIKDTLVSKETSYSQQSTIISLLTGFRVHDTMNPDFGLLVQRRVLGPFYLGAFGFKNMSFGIGIGLAL